MNTVLGDIESRPKAQYLGAEVVLLEMAETGSSRVRHLRTGQVLVLSTMAGGFITVGALFSVLLGTGTEVDGIRLLLQGFGFSTGFFLVVLSGALLFTEVNVELPATLLHRDPRVVAAAVFKLWFLAAVGNLLGAWLVGYVIEVAHDYSGSYYQQLAETVDAKMKYRTIGGVDGWAEAVVSGVLGNWLVGVAAFLAVMGRTIIGKFVPVLITVTAFVAAGFMHSPANMGYVALAQGGDVGPGWGPALAWAIAPAAVGNVLGALLLVALPFWYAYRRPTVESETTGQ